MRDLSGGGGAAVTERSVKRKMAGNFQVSSGSETNAPLDTTEYNNGGFVAFENGIKFPVAGRYRVSAFVQFQDSGLTSGVRALALNRTGSGSAVVWANHGAGGPTRVYLTNTFDISDTNEKWYLSVYQTSGSQVTVDRIELAAEKIQ